MIIDPRFFRFAALCSLLSAITTLLLIFLPEWFAPAPDFAARMARIHDRAYLLRSWVYLLHPFLVFTAALGLALTLRRQAPLRALFGMLGFLLWAFNEAGQQTLTLFAFDHWRAAWETADASLRATIRINAAMYDGIWDGMYALLLIGFTVGNACVGWALIDQPGLARYAGAFMLAAVLLTLALLCREIGFPVAPESVLNWSYPAIQPLGRILIGAWLWRIAALEVTEAMPRADAALR
jgi:hypothetical protein